MKTAAKNVVPFQAGKETAMVDDERGLLALEASWEIAEISDLMLEKVGAVGLEGVLFRGLAARIKELNSAMMSAVGEEAMTNADIHVMVHKTAYKPKAAKA
ncbi:hypothetical protein H0A66_03735 [Alcaligenaceae bacterium]|nr:hypothetical protein [Alcaligenaceae bacterium]